MTSLTRPRLSVLLLPAPPPQDGSKPHSDADIMSLRGIDKPSLKVPSHGLWNEFCVGTCILAHRYMCSLCILGPDVILPALSLLSLGRCPTPESGPQLLTD